MVVGGRAGVERPWQLQDIWWLGAWGIKTTLESDEVFIGETTVVRKRRSRGLLLLEPRAGDGWLCAQPVKRQPTTPHDSDGSGAPFGLVAVRATHR